MATSFEQRRIDFGKRLRTLREERGLSAKELAAAIGWNAPKLSKLETAKQTASLEDLRAWLVAMEIRGEVGRSLGEELVAIHDEYVTWKAQVKLGHRARQEEALQAEQTAKVIRAVDVGVVPGLLQTPDYARHALLASAGVHGGGQDIPDAVRTRMRRQQVLYEPDRTIEILMTESALLHPVAPTDVMAGQVHRLMAVIGTPNVRFGILPARALLPFPLVHGYWIVDQLVTVELLTGEYRVTDPEEVATYGKLTDQLWSAAAEGNAARELLAHSAEDFTTGA